MARTKLTLTVDPDVLAEAKAKAQSQHTSISGLVENFLQFYSEARLYCFSCGVALDVTERETCAKCGFLKCSDCAKCGCDLSDEARQAVFHMRRVYEELLAGRVG
ncbi:MAG TPA: hypothetical protein EYI97_01745 [Candidatus Poseidoniales archaeon]|nr:hypothetical protein [Candidatus Poseidoniales archaeon]|tara:strand:- start:813 stop:1127 length:315 start_codon:yes stop_codon:yes gene_type:complete